MRIVIIGSGNVAYQLHRALLQAEGVSLVQVAARRPEALEDFDARVPRAGLSQPLARADVYILAVSDQAVGPVSEQLTNLGGLIVHTSGALGLDVLKGSRHKGVFYPLQTFSRGRPVHFADIPVLLEATHPKDLDLLESLGHSLGARTCKIDRQGRLAAHLAAVFANNFSNHMAWQAQELCTAYGLDPGLLVPLLRETFEKLREMPAREAQTGPARRRDRNTQEAHRKLLEPGIPLELYNLISYSIEKTYENEL
jgi:predicted short-subunit dehydrogenase-like oxidoreductase (DUF2520 family)